jgi:hypothetical protein
LNAVSPNLLPSGFPEWYQDGAGRALQLCLSGVDNGNGPLCPLALPNPNAPIDFPGNFPNETFWFHGDATVPTTAGTADLTTALEAAFGGGAVVNGDQISFARIRIRIDVPAPGGNYRVIHPYGVEEFANVQPGASAIDFTSAVGVAGPPPAFAGALAGAIGPFLTPAATPGGTPLPPIDVALESFIGDPNVPGAVTGSAFATNFFRVEGPNVGGSSVNSVQTDQFRVSGQIFAGALRTPLSITRASYARTAAGQVDVFATSAPDAILTLSGGPNLPAGIPEMLGDGLGNFFSHVTLADAITLPPFITIAASALPNTDSVTSSVLTDVVTITKAEFDTGPGTLIIQAVSSDKGAPAPTLTARGFIPGTLSTVNGVATLVVSGLDGPPPTVTVQSSAGGSDTAPVQIGVAAEELIVTFAQYITKTKQWRVQGFTSKPGSSIHIFNTGGLLPPQLAVVTADRLGLWSFVSKTARKPNAARRISVRSSGGAALAGKPVTVFR